MKKGEVRVFTKSGNPVRLIEKTSVTIGSNKISCWEVERVDTLKKMICPVVALARPQDVLDKDDLIRYGFYS